jgi:transposase InsO family protein
MQTRTAPPTSLPFELGEARSFGGLTVVPLFAAAQPQVEYVGLDEAAAGGLTVTEVSDAGSVESLLVVNPLADPGLVYGSHRDRAAALPHWLDHYNTRRPHSSLGGRPPISRVHNVRGQDI